MAAVKHARGIQDETPDIDETLTEIMVGYQFLSNERTFSIGMGGAIPNAIPLVSILAYYSTFPPSAAKKHFVRVVRSADNEYMKMQADKANKKTPTGPISSAGKNGNGFPAL